MQKQLAKADDALKEVEIEGAGALGEGQMLELKVGDKDKDKVLITRYQGKLRATGAFCTHFGFPLAKGLMFDDKVTCPLHAASFSVVTGAINSAAGLDGLPTYDIVHRDGKAFVVVPEDGISKQS